ncbi:MAG TPA: ABC transporter ATP-binding protein [Candidatus Fraserbacteria bacterium]|nr:ABC transporter ATP-binding protein [Candidatus Fraserbacteria bacterium]
MSTVIPSLKARWRTRLTVYRQVFGLLLQYPAVSLSLIAVSIVAALASVLQIGLVIPILQSAQSGASSLSHLPLLGYFGQLAAHMDAVGKIRFVAVALIIITLIQGVFTYASQLLSMLLQIRVDRSLRSQVFRQLLDVELRFIHREQIGNLFTILNSYTSTTGTLIATVAGAFLSLFTVLMYAAALLIVSWQLTLLALALLFLVFMVIRKRFSAQISQAGSEVNQAVVRLNSIGMESLSAIKLIHLFARERRSQEQFEQALRHYQDQMYRRGKLVSLMSPLFTTLVAVVLSLLLIASTLVLPQQVGDWMGLMLLLLIIMYRLMSPAAALNNVRAQVASLYPAMRSMLYFLQRQDKTYLQSGSINFSDLNEGVALENVTFRYGAGEASVLQAVSFDIPKGWMTAVVGPSGAGKTTLVDLLARLYDPQEGQIRVDGVDLRELELDSWRSRIAVVSQETFIFNDTVATNLRFAKEEATEEELQRAARLANAHEFIMELPQGYDTLLGDRGVRLSGGEQQRIAIARAILADPQLLILDEATSNLDSETERDIQEAIERVSRERTVLAIAHRLSTIRRADKIVVLYAGQVVEQGTHEALMRQRGRYWRLVQMQSLEGVRAVEG